MSKTRIKNRTIVERLILQLDSALKTMTQKPVAARSSPAKTPAKALTRQEQRVSAQYMRVNHAGEIAAQGLYQAQAIFARDPEIAEKMRGSALEENDHLAWCETRLQELNSHTSYLTGIWFLGSFMVGAIAGFAGDRWSLGFVAETERQVMIHLDQNLQGLPLQDLSSRQIVQQMYEDESQHAHRALEAGGKPFTQPLRFLMQAMAKVMTLTARWI